MTGLAGFAFTSATGAKFMFTPTARSPRAVAAATASVSASSSAAPNAIAAGGVGTSVRRKTPPPSWSIATIKSGPATSRSSAT